MEEHTLRGRGFARLRGDPRYRFTTEELLGCLSDMATRDVQLCTTAVDHLYMICPCFLDPPASRPAADHNNNGKEVALADLQGLHAFFHDKRRQQEAVVAAATTVDGEGAASVATVEGDQDQAAAIVVDGEGETVATVEGEVQAAAIVVDGERETVATMDGEVQAAVAVGVGDEATVEILRFSNSSIEQRDTIVEAMDPQEA